MKPDEAKEAVKKLDEPRQTRTRTTHNYAALAGVNFRNQK